MGQEHHKILVWQSAMIHQLPLEYTLQRKEGRKEGRDKERM
jgi:hypothetical protein